LDTDKFPGGYSYSLIREVSTPVGIFRIGKHSGSNELRGLKILKNDLAGRPVFMAWYTAAVTLAGQSAETLHRAGITNVVGPMKAPDGKYLTQRDGAWVVERQYRGMENEGKTTAWNLGQFIESFHAGAPGLNEDVALAIMTLMAKTVKAMHGLKVYGPKNELLHGAPHLNLKPENALICLNERRQDYEVVLTDHQLPMSSPLVEANGIKTRLNYSSPDILREDGYYDPSADIFSCGLLLYRLLEGRDLIPADWSRSSILDHIANHLTDALRNLGLTSASDKSSLIIKKCLTQSYERYASIGDLLDDLERAQRGKDPSVILKDFISTYRKPEPPPPPKPTPAWVWRSLIGAGVVVILALVAWGVMWYLHNERMAKLRTDVGKLRTTWEEPSWRACLTREALVSRRGTLNAVDEAIFQDNSDLADDLLAKSRTQLSADSNFCAKVGMVRQHLDQALADRESYPRAEEFRPRYEECVDGAIAYFGHGDNSGVDRQVNFANAILDSMRVWLCDSVSTRISAQQWVNNIPGLTQTCRKQKAQPLADSLIAACGRSDKAAYESFTAKKGTFSCESRPPVTPPVVDTPIQVQPQAPIEVPCATRMRPLQRILRKMRIRLADSVQESSKPRGTTLCEEADQALTDCDTNSFEVKRAEFYELPSRPRCTALEGKFDQLRALDARISPLFAAFGISESSSQMLQYFKNAVQVATRAMSEDSCDKAEFHINDGLHRMSGISDVENALSELGQRLLTDSLDPDCKGRLDLVKQQLEVCNWAALNPLLPFLRQNACWKAKDTSPPPPPPKCVYDSCSRKFGLASWNEAARCCGQVDEKDPGYRYACTYYVLAVGEGNISVDRLTLRKKFLNSISDPNSLDNRKLNAIMAIAHGWDMATIDFTNALTYSDSALRDNVIMQSEDYYWKTLFVRAQCWYKKWTLSVGNGRLKANARQYLAEFIGYVDARTPQGADASRQKAVQYREIVRIGVAPTGN
jgi:hypothetical protein